MPLDLLEAARQKLAEAESIPFEMSSVWNNTYIGDTMVYATHKGIYLRNNFEGFPCDFVCEMEKLTYAYRDGKLEDIEADKGWIVTFNEDDSRGDLAYEGNYTSMMTPMALVKDSAWARAGQEWNIVFYDKELSDRKGEDGHTLYFYTPYDLLRGVIYIMVLLIVAASPALLDRYWMKRQERRGKVKRGGLGLSSSL